MINLFNGIYLDEIKNHRADEDGVAVTSDPVHWPMKMRSVMSVGGVAIGEDKVETFWAQLCELRDRRFVLYADARAAALLLGQFYTSTLRTTSRRDLEYLFRSYFCSLKLVWMSSRWSADFAALAADYEQAVALLDDPEATRRITCLTRLPRESMSLEVSLANFYLDGQHPSSAAFLLRVQDIVWDACFDAIEILKRDLLNAAFNLSKIFPAAQISPRDLASPFRFMENEPSLRWVFDEALDRQNRAYVTATYRAEDFTEIFKAVARARALDERNRGDVSVAIEDEDYFRVTRAAFAESPLGLLLDENKKGFGHILFNDRLWKETNHAVVATITECLRSGSLDAIEFLRLP